MIHNKDLNALIPLSLASLGNSSRVLYKHLHNEASLQVAIIPRKKKPMCSAKSQLNMTCPKEHVLYLLKTMGKLEMVAFSSSTEGGRDSQISMSSRLTPSMVISRPAKDI